MRDDRSSTQVRNIIQQSRGNVDNFDSANAMKILDKHVLEYIKNNLFELYGQINNRQ